MPEDHREGLPPPVTLSYSSEDVLTNNARAQSFPRVIAQHDELERRLQSRSTDDPEVQTFLRDYSRFKKQTGVRFFASVVEYDLFQPPFTFQSPFMPDLPAVQREGNGHLKEKTSFSDMLRFLRPALHAGTTDCARFL